MSSLQQNKSIFIIDRKTERQKDRKKERKDYYIRLDHGL